MAISNKDKEIFDYWNHYYCNKSVETDNFHINNSLYSEIKNTLEPDEFILSFPVHKSELFKELFK